MHKVFETTETKKNANLEITTKTKKNRCTVHTETAALSAAYFIDKVPRVK